MFVAVADDSTILTSPDGLVLGIKASQKHTTAVNLGGVAFGSNTFVAVGYGIILTSTDGISWQEWQEENSNFIE